MAVNLSDIAAMGGRPTAAVVGIVAPPGSGGLMQDLHLGTREMADRYQVPIVGGDTNSWNGGLVVSVTLLGVPIREPVLRSGAMPGDWVFVTGPLGGSILGRHLNPVPRLVEAERLVSFCDMHAMIDVSDGLAKDAGHVAVESRCGIVFEADAIPVHSDAVKLAKQSGKTPLQHALGDGEDFELVFTVSPDDGAKLIAEPPIPVWKIGECLPEAGLWIVERGVRVPLHPTGWEHQL